MTNKFETTDTWEKIQDNWAGSSGGKEILTKNYIMDWLREQSEEMMSAVGRKVAKNALDVLEYVESRVLAPKLCDTWKEETIEESEKELSKPSWQRLGEAKSRLIELVYDRLAIESDFSSSEDDRKLFEAATERIRQLSTSVEDKNTKRTIVDFSDKPKEEIDKMIESFKLGNFQDLFSISCPLKLIDCSEFNTEEE